MHDEIIYLVVGTQGIYSDRKIWNVTWFSDEEAANAYVEALYAKHTELVGDYNETFDWPDPEPKNPLDPHWTFQANVLDSEPIEYSVEPILEGRLPDA